MAGRDKNPGQTPTLHALGLDKRVADKLDVRGVRSLQKLADMPVARFLGLPGIGHRALKLCCALLRGHLQELRTSKTLGEAVRQDVARNAGFEAGRSALKEDREFWKTVTEECERLLDRRDALLSEQRALQQDMQRMRDQRSQLVAQLSCIERAIGEFELHKRAAESLRRADEILSQATTSRDELKLAEALRVLGAEQNVLAVMRLSAGWLNEPPFKIGPLMLVPSRWWHRQRSSSAQSESPSAVAGHA